MSLKRIIRCLAAGICTIAIFGSTAYARTNVRDVGNINPIQIVIDSNYIEAKVNDPVTRKDKKAYIVSDNAEFHFVSDYYAEVDAIFYINEFIEGQDKGVSNRVLKKVVSMGEQLTMLPDEIFEEDVADGSAYRFTDRCYDVRVFYGPNNNTYEDFYFGLVDEETFQRMAQKYEDSDSQDASAT